MNSVIAFIFLLGIVSIAGFVWQMRNVKEQQAKRKHRSKRGPNRRSSDVSELNRKDKKIYKRAKVLEKERRYTQAAQLLESINMHRDAIDILEKAGLIHEAAKILMRMGRHNRAGVVYARNKYWERAAESFRYAKMPLDAAKCAMMYGNLEIAAEQYEQAEKYKEAGDLHVKMGNTLKASKLYVKIGDFNEAVPMFAKLIGSAKDEVPFEPHEVRLMAEWLKQGNFDSHIADVIVESNRLLEVLLELLIIQKADVALKIYKKSEPGTGSQLLSQVDYENKAMWQELIKLFLFADELKNAGVVFENKNKFKEAAESFERGGDLVRSAHCYDRAGMMEKAKEVREHSLNPQSVKAASSIHSSSSPFAIKNVATRNNEQIKDMIPPPPPPPPLIHAPPLTPSKRHDLDQNAEHNTEKSGDFRSSNESTKEVFVGDALAVKLNLEKKDDKDHFPSMPPTDVFDDLQEGDDIEQFFVPPTKESDDISIEIKSLSEKTQHNEVPNAYIKNATMIVEDKDTFKKSSLMSVLNEVEKEKLWQIGRSQDYEKGEIILNYDEEPAGAYFILRGNVSCFRKDSNSNDKQLDVMGPTKTFGELWLLADHPTEVRFIAEEYCKLRIIDRDRFNELLDREGIIARKVYKKFTGRLVSSLLSSNATSVKKRKQSA